ncbi:MAG: signal peptide peptidase SppA, partial [Bacteroidota bacterium]
ASLSEQKPSISSNTVLRLDFDDPIPEHTDNLSNGSFSLNEKKILGLHKIVATIDNAANDDKIKGIFLETDLLSVPGFSATSELRKALQNFKDQGKFIIAYSKYYSQAAYYLASVADEVYMPPMGIIDMRGFAAQVPFYKEMLDKVGIEMQVFYAGDFKSATEPVRRREMSDSNRLQLRVFLDAMQNTMIGDIAKSRNIAPSDLEVLIDEFAGGVPKRAEAAGLVDSLAYREDVLDAIRAKLGYSGDRKIKFASLSSYNKANPPKMGDYDEESRIAVVYAEGNVVDGKGNNGEIADLKYNKVFEKIRKSKKIKAVVLRINSPGGSSLSADNMYQAIEAIKESGKPVIVSMGDYAASAGYYIAAHADSIIAQENTLTGSIGVFSMVPNAENMLNNKLGIKFDTVQTGKMSAGLTPFYGLSESEKKWFQTRTDVAYDSFLELVAEGRDMTKEEVGRIAKGRVWTGMKAKELGLVDEIGGMEKAIEIAAEKAGISSYRLVEYPYVKSQFEQLLEELSGDLDPSTAFSKTLKAKYPALHASYDHIESLINSKGLQATLPFVIPFE